MAKKILTFRTHSSHILKHGMDVILNDLCAYGFNIKEEIKQAPIDSETGEVIFYQFQEAESNEIFKSILEHQNKNRTT